MFTHYVAQRRPEAYLRRTSQVPGLVANHRLRSTKAGGVPPANHGNVTIVAKGGASLNEGRRRTSGEPIGGRGTLALGLGAQRRPEAYLRRTIFVLDGLAQHGLSLNEGRRRTSGEPTPLTSNVLDTWARSTKAGGVPPANLIVVKCLPQNRLPLNEGRRRTSGEPFVVSPLSSCNRSAQRRPEAYLRRTNALPITLNESAQRSTKAGGVPPANRRRRRGTSGRQRPAQRRPEAYLRRPKEAGMLPPNIP